MPRLTTDLTPLLPKMRAARENVAHDTVIQGTELAAMAGMTWRILKGRILRDKAFPVLNRGANGKAWSFNAAISLDHLISDIERQAAERGAMKRRVEKRAGMKKAVSQVAEGAQTESPSPANAGNEPVDSALDIAAHARALNALAQAQMTTHKMKQLQGEVIPAEKHASVIATIMSTMQTETLAIEAKIDPTGTLPPFVRQALKDELRNVLLTVQAACERELSRKRA